MNSIKRRHEEQSDRPIALVIIQTVCGAKWLSAQCISDPGAMYSGMDVSPIYNPVLPIPPAPVGSRTLCGGTNYVLLGIQELSGLSPGRGIRKSGLEQNGDQNRGKPQMSGRMSPFMLTEAI